MTEATTKDAGEWRSGYKIVVAALFGIGLGLSPLPYYTIIVLSEPMMLEFGWSLGDVFGCFIYSTLGVFVGSPIVGFLTDRYGARRTALISILFLAALMACLSQMNGSLALYYGTFFAMGTLGAGTLPVTFTRAINNNFDKTRGLALGIALMGTGITGFIVPGLTQTMIDHYGWRTTFQLLGLLPLLISFPVAFFWFRDQKEEALLGEGGKLDASIVPGMPFAAVLKDWRFFAMGLGFLMVGASVSGLIPNIKFLLQDQGYTPQMSASKFMGVGLIGFSVLVGRSAGGYLVDKFWAPGIAFFLLILPVISCFIFLTGDNPIWLNTLAICFVGIAAGVEFDLMAFLVAKYFGMKSYGKVYGALYAMFGLGAGFSPGIFGFVRDTTGSYDAILMIASALVFVGSLLLLTIGGYRRFNSEGQLVPKLEAAPVAS
jgi:MFS family permease